MAPRPCLDCGRLTNASRCGTCQRQHRQHYAGDWTKLSARARAAHLATHGPWCPGLDRSPHQVRPDQLQLDHTTGTVLCNVCNVHAGPAPGRGASNL